jgi:uncharacterized protein YbaR (Trm112 family)
MGMFDTIHMTVACPVCKNETLMEVQTKDLDCELKDFNVGDNFILGKSRNLKFYEDLVLVMKELGEWESHYKPLPKGAFYC